MLTKTQANIVARLRAGETVRLNGRARRTVEKLRNMGLCTYVLEVAPDALRGRHTFIYSLRAYRC